MFLRLWWIDCMEEEREHVRGMAQHERIGCCIPCLLYGYLCGADVQTRGLRLLVSKRSRSAPAASQFHSTFSATIPGL